MSGPTLHRGVNVVMIDPTWRPLEVDREIPSDLPRPSTGGEGDEPRLPLRVLVAEDHPINRKVVLRMLGRMACPAEAVDDGLLAVRARLRSEHDLILMDVQMPVMDGRAATLEIRRLELDRGLPRIPILAMTAEDQDADRLRCLEAGMDGHLSKPVTASDLLAWLTLLAGPGRMVPGGRPEKFGVETLLERCGGDRRFVDDLIGACLETIPTSIRALGEALGSADFRRVASESHGLKGAARTIGAEDLAGRCVALERAAGFGDLVASREALGEIVGGWAGLRPVLWKITEGDR